MASYKFFKGLVSLCVLFSVTSTSYAIKPQGKNQQRGSMMKIRIDIDGTQQPLFATLAITPTVEDFIKQLQLHKTRLMVMRAKLVILPIMLRGVIWLFSIKILILVMPMASFFLGNLMLFPTHSSKNNTSKFQFPKSNKHLFIHSFTLFKLRYL